MNELIAMTFMTGRNRKKQILFHFKGVYRGKLIKRLMVNDRGEHELIKNQEYLLHLRVLDYEALSQTLVVEIIRVKKLEQLRGLF